MADDFEVLYLHTVSASSRHDVGTEVATIEERLGTDIRVASTFDESKELIEKAEIVFATARGIQDELLDRADQLQWIQGVSSGVDGFRLDQLDEDGIILTNAAGVNAEPIAEQVFGYMITFERQLHRGIRRQRTRTWERFEGGELHGKTVGLIGVGAIGSRVAEIASAFEMQVLGVKRHPETAPDTVDEVLTPDQLDEMLVEADYVVVACPLTDETRGLIGQAEIEAMKQSAVLINVSRGPIVDYDALTIALQEHVIAGAGLDVYPREPFPRDSPLWGLSNVILTPHMAGSTPRTAKRLARLFEENYQAFVNGDFDAMPTRVV